MVNQYKKSESDGMTIGDRMKFNYEFPFLYRFPHRMPLIIRIDGRAFHTLSRKMQWKKPFDLDFIKNMQELVLDLCREIMNVKLVYLQSDEASFLCVDYEKIETQPWFRNEVQKLCSITAGLASAKMSLKLDHEAVFDARAFVVPPFEVCNYFIWRQWDWIRNSIQMAARSQFSQKQIHGLNSSELQEKLWQDADINWNAYETFLKRGSCVIYKDQAWIIDNEIPDFTKDRTYIHKYIPEFMTVGVKE